MGRAHQQLPSTLSKPPDRFQALFGVRRGRAGGEVDWRWHPYGVRAPVLVAFVERARTLTDAQLRAYRYQSSPPDVEASQAAHIVLGEDRQGCLDAVYADIFAIAPLEDRADGGPYGGAAWALNRAALGLLTADRLDGRSFRRLVRDGERLLHHRLLP